MATNPHEEIEKYLGGKIFPFYEYCVSFYRSKNIPLKKQLGNVIFWCDICKNTYEVDRQTGIIYYLDFPEKSSNKTKTCKNCNKQTRRKT